MEADQVALIGLGVLVSAVIGLYFVGRSLKSKTGLGPNYQKYKIIRKDNISHNTRLFRCALQTKETVLGLPCGKHLAIRGKQHPEYKEEIERNYTPTSSDDNIGYFDLVIKIYTDGPKGAGLLTPYLDTLNVGDFIEAKGPKGHIHYDRDSHFSVFDRVKKTTKSWDVPKINMIAGGTGLTPMYQIIQEIVSKDHSTQVKMIYGNVSEDDILCRAEMEQFRKHKNVEIVMTLDKAPAGWKEEEGYVTDKMITKYCFGPADDVVTLLCGPPGLIKGCKGALGKLGHGRKNIWCF